MAIRTYVKVSANVDECGKITPLCLTFKGIEYAIDQLFDVRQAAAINAEGQGIRYSIRIGLHKTYLFQDDSQRWFVEEKVPHEIARVGGLVATDCSYRF